MSLVVVGVLLILGAAIPGVLWRTRARVADAAFRALMVAGCAVLAVPAIRALARGAVVAGSVHSTLPGRLWPVGLDRLSAWAASV